MAHSVFLLIFNVISATAVRSLDLESCCSHVHKGGAAVRNSTEGPSLAPQDVRLNWMSDFEPQLSWKPPPHLPPDCCFCVKVNSMHSSLEQQPLLPSESNFSDVFFTKDGSLSMSVQTICDNMMSEPVNKTSIYPELVTDLDCYILSLTLIRCTWRPITGAPTSTFFYRSEFDRTVSLQPCPNVYNDSTWTTCDLQLSNIYTLVVLFNGTVDNKTVRNTFRKDLDIKPSFKNWTVVPADGKFHISWVVPDDTDPSRWTFMVLYRECAHSKMSDQIMGYHTKIDRLPTCRYCFSVQASFGKRESSTEEKCFDADLDVFFLAAIIVPLTCVALAALALVCFKRCKDSIFPPIPKPRDLLSDILDNNNKTQFENIHFPSEVEELFKITMVTDLPNDKPDW